MDKKTLVIGIGSVLRGDDGIGARIVDELEKEDIPKSVTLERGDLSGLDLLKYFPNFENVVVIDAADMKEKPGTIKVFKSKEIEKNAFQDSVSTHGMALPETLVLAERLEIPSDITIVGVQPESIAFNLELTKTIQEKIPAILDTIKELLNKV